MKYLKLFENIQSYEAITTLIDNALIPLGISIKYVKNTNGFTIELDPNITPRTNTTSVLCTLMYTLQDSDYIDDVSPVFNNPVLGYHHTEDRIKYYINTKASDNFTRTNDYRYIWTTQQKYYNDLIQRLILTFKDSTGEFSIYSTTHMPDGSDIHKYIFLKNLILNYLNYLSKQVPENININMLYEITYDSIVKSEDPYTLFYTIKKYNEELYEELMKYTKPNEIDNSDKMKEMGF